VNQEVWSKSVLLKIGIILTVLIVAGALGEHFLSHPITTSNNSSSPYFDYMVVIMMENKNLNQTYGDSCIGNCTYITQLADNFSIAKNYSGVAHGSLPNYLTLTSGGNYAYTPFLTSCGPQVGNCTVSSRNIVDSIEESHRTWRGYIEDYSGGCKGSSDNHNEGLTPFLYYTDIYYNATRCSNIVDANPTHEGYLGLPTRLLSDLNNADQTPNFMWLTPNECNNGHNACNSTAITPSCHNLAQCVSQGNSYLSLLVPQILKSHTFENKNAALFIIWDEGGGVNGFGNICPKMGQTYPICIDRVPAILVGSHVRHGFVSNESVSHYSLVKTLELAWSLPFFTPLDTAATPMTGFFDIPLHSSPGQIPPLIDWTLADRICRYE
jgi:hypothetical protein